jgi:uncharacterized membrane protein (UPF0182 family)
MKITINKNQELQLISENEIELNQLETLELELADHHLMYTHGYDSKYNKVLNIETVIDLL